MQYNECKTCGANNGRCGMTINGECSNCYQTRKTGDVHVDLFFPRTETEVQKTMAILNATKGAE